MGGKKEANVACVRLCRQIVLLLLKRVADRKNVGGFLEGGLGRSVEFANTAAATIASLKSFTAEPLEETVRPCVASSACGKREIGAGGLGGERGKGGGAPPAS